MQRLGGNAKGGTSGFQAAPAHPTCRRNGGLNACTRKRIENFGGLLEEKIRLMELHAGDEPHIDPGFMWRMQRMSH